MLLNVLVEKCLEASADLKAIISMDAVLYMYIFLKINNFYPGASPIGFK
jgi:hypothetical protein